MTKKTFEVRRRQAGQPIHIHVNVYEGDPAGQQKQDYGFPENLLVGPINWVILSLEATMTRFVDHGLKKLDKLRKRRRQK